jgi:NAD(P)-dependent dehydrogenase (short-subunit alcohol dehydrogenase family)
MSSKQASAPITMIVTGGSQGIGAGLVKHLLQLKDVTR